jgi:hypothetical protein
MRFIGAVVVGYIAMVVGAPIWAAGGLFVIVLVTGK